MGSVLRPTGSSGRSAGRALAALASATLIATLALPSAAALAQAPGPSADQAAAITISARLAGRPDGVADAPSPQRPAPASQAGPLPVVPAQILVRPGGEVCLFREPGYGGARWCVPAGTKVTSLAGTGWDDAISSIRISGRAVVYACRLPGFSGGCRLYAASQPQLRGFDDAISSFFVIAGRNPNAL